MTKITSLTGDIFQHLKHPWNCLSMRRSCIKFQIHQPWKKNQINWTPKCYSISYIWQSFWEKIIFWNYYWTPGTLYRLESKAFVIQCFCTFDSFLACLGRNWVPKISNSTYDFLFNFGFLESFFILWFLKYTCKTLNKMEQKKSQIPILVLSIWSIKLVSTSSTKQATGTKSLLS